MLSDTQRTALRLLADGVDMCPPRGTLKALVRRGYARWFEEWREFVEFNFYGVPVDKAKNIYRAWAVITEAGRRALKEGE